MANLRFSPNKKGGVKTVVSPQSDALTAGTPVSNTPWFPTAVPSPNVLAEEKGEPVKKPEIVDESVPFTTARTIEVINPNFYQPRDVQDILSAPVFLPKWMLYCNMEVFWPRVQKNMDFLKHCVSNKSFVLKPFEAQDDEKDLDGSPDNVGYGDSMTKYALVNEAMKNLQSSIIYNRNGFKGIIHDIVDSYGKGLSVQQIFWDLKEDRILPVNTQYVNAYYYKYDISNNAITAMSGEPLDENKFLVAAYKNRGTLNLTALGVYQALAYIWVGQFWARKFWLQSVEKYGQPFRTVEYPQGSSATVKNALAAAMANFGNSGYGVFPAGSNFQLIESAIANGTNNAHGLFIEDSDKTCDLLMLGQNLTTDASGGGSYAAAVVHERKETTVIDNLCDFVTDVLNNQFIPAILDVNGFDQENRPFFTVDNNADLDMLKKKLDIVQQLRGLGYKIQGEGLESELEQLGLQIEEMTPEEKLAANPVNQMQDKTKNEPKKFDRSVSSDEGNEQYAKK
jgi:hypothetical protein